MPLTILVPMVVLGIAGIGLLLHVLGLSQRKLFGDLSDARAAWLDEFPEDRPTRMVMSHDHRAALVDTDKGHGVVWPMGADSTARYLDGAKLARTPTGLRIDLPDYTAPRIDLELDAEEVARWPMLMEN